MKFKIANPTLLTKGFLRIIRAEVTYDAFKGTEPITATREMLDRGDSVAILVYENDTNSFVLTNQFRYPVADKDSNDSYINAGWLLELPAGRLEEGEDPQDAAVRELEEEIGYFIDEIELMHIFYVSPGGTSERVHLYYTEVSSEDKKWEGGGLKWEKEDIRVEKIHATEIEDRMDTGLLRDAKTIIALQWWMLNKAMG